MEKKAKKDYDGDGKIESGKDEYFGSRDKAIKKAMAKKGMKESTNKLGLKSWQSAMFGELMVRLIDLLKRKMIHQQQRLM